MRPLSRPARDGSQLRSLTEWPGSAEEEPNWSPDGQRIVFASSRGGSGFNLWIAEVDGGEPALLTSLPMGSYSSHARFFPDGSQIAFVSNRSGTKQIWKISADGQRVDPLTDLPFPTSDPAWSPSGAQVVFTGCAEVCSLYVVDSDGSGVHRITEDARTTIPIGQ
jgi:TolB protein